MRMTRPRTDRGPARHDHGRRAPRLEPAIRRLLHLYWRFARAMTLGVRALVIDHNGRVFLVKHSYVERLAPAGRRGGGRRDAGRGAGARAARGGQYRARRRRRGCTACSSTTAIPGATMCACSWCATFRQSAAPVPDREIVAHGFFAVDAAARRYHRRHPRPHRRGARRRPGQRAVVIDCRQATTVLGLNRSILTVAGSCWMTSRHAMQSRRSAIVQRSTVVQ